MKNSQLFWLISLSLAFLGAVLFFAPIIYALPYLEEYGGETAEEARIFFISFFSKDALFFAHSSAVILSFLGFLTAILSIFREKIRHTFAFLALILSLIVIFTYLAGYEKLFFVIY